MSENADKESQTEEATEKKLNDALQNGVVPLSPEAAVTASLGAMLVSMAFLLPGAVGRLSSMLVHFIDDPSGWRIETGGDARVLGAIVFTNAALALAPVVAAMAVFGLAASLAQNSPRIVLERIRPKFSRISPREGLSRIFGLNGWVAFARNMVKFTAVTAIAIALLASNRTLILDSSAYDIMGLPVRISTLCIKLLAALVVAAATVAVADLVWARIHWRRSQRMSRQEIKEELKQLEGDPLLKARLRSIRMDRARKRMLTAVPKATMVVVNPTHYAVAMRYVRSEGGVPVVVAKGLDLIALRIREIAEANSIPVIEDKPLARSLYGAVKVDKAIPPEFYRAIAEIIHQIYRRKAAPAVAREARDR